MRILLFLLILSTASPCYAWMTPMIVGAPSGEGGVTCSGSGPGGDNEPFEAGDPDYCTTGWGLSDGDGVINTSDPAQFNCGSNSFSMTCSSSNTAINRGYLDLGGVDNDNTLRIYVYLPAMSSGHFIRPLSAGDQNDETTAGTLFLQWHNSSGTYQAKVRTSGTNPSEYFNLTPATWYYLEIHAVKNSTTAMRVWTVGGTPVETSVGGGDVEQTVSAQNVDMEYWVIQDTAAQTTPYTIYFDDGKYNDAGVEWIGGQTCE